MRAETVFHFTVIRGQTLSRRALPRAYEGYFSLINVNPSDWTCYKILDKKTMLHLVCHIRLDNSLLQYHS